MPHEREFSLQICYLIEIEWHNKTLLMPTFNFTFDTNVFYHSSIPKGDSAQQKH